MTKLPSVCAAALELHRKSTLVGITVAATVLAWAPPSHARVTRIIIDATASIPGQPSYELLTGRAFGELDPNDPHNILITDIGLAVNANGKAEYIASFRIRKPKEGSSVSGLMWHDVPNRGGDVLFPNDSFAASDVQLLSGWQGDNAGGTTIPVNAGCLPPYALPCAVPPFTNHWVKVPVLAGVTGKILARIVNRSGPAAQSLNVMGNPIPYFPADWTDNSGDTLKTHTKETLPGVVAEGKPIPNSDWKFCGGGTFDTPTPVTMLPVKLCLRNGFDPANLYQLVSTGKDPYVLGAGTAAFRDVQSFFRYAAADDFGTKNPLAGKIRWSIIRGVSQSGNFTRHFIFLGMNQDESGRIVHEGAWPLIAGRRVA